MKNKLPDGWEEVILGDVSLDKGQYGSGASAIDYDSKCPRYIRITDIDEEGQLKNNDLKSPSETEERYFLEYGDFLFARSGSVGRTYLHIKKDGKYQYAGYLIRFKLNQKIILPKYLYYITKSNYYWGWIEKTQKSVTISNINARQYASFSFILPPLQTQKHIVSILEKAESAKSMRQDADELTKDYLNAVFLEMFGDPKSNPKKWSMVPTQNLFNMKLGKMLSAKNYTGKHLKPYLRNINVQWGYLDLSDIKQMDFDDKEFPKYLLKKGDILVCEGGEVGRTAIYNGEIKDCCYQNALHRLRIKNKEIEPLYFVYFMIFAAKYGLIQKSTIQVTIAHFTAEKFAKFKIMLPSINLQLQFSKIVEQVEKLKEYQKESKKQIDNLFNALMQRAFKGELI